MTLAGYYFNQFTTMQYVDFCVRLLVAFLIGGAVGLERSNRFKEAGIRTHIIVCVTSTLIMLISKSLRKESKMVQTKKQHCAFR